jgi:hypothetical protein
MSPNRDRQYKPKKSIKRNILISIATLATLFIITGCEPPPLPETESPEAKMYLDKCSTCHPVRHPKMFSYKRWIKFVDDMEKKVKSSGVREPLTAEEREIILSYFKKHSQM